VTRRRSGLPRPSFAAPRGRTEGGCMREKRPPSTLDEGSFHISLGGVLITLGYSAGRKTTIDVTDLIWKSARMFGFSLFAQSPTAIANAWRDIIPLIVGGSIKPIVERVYSLGETGEGTQNNCPRVAKPIVHAVVFFSELHPSYRSRILAERRDHRLDGEKQGSAVFDTR